MKKQNFLQSSLILLTSAAITKVIGAIFRIPIANMLGGVGMGYFSTAYGIFMTIYAVTVSGLPIAVAKLTSENCSLERYTKATKTKKIALKTFTLIGLAFSVLLVAAAFLLCKYVFHSTEAVFAVIVIAPSILFGSIAAVYRGYYEGLRNMYPTAISQIFEAIVKLLGGLFFCSFVLAKAQTDVNFISNTLELFSPFLPSDFFNGTSPADFVFPLASAGAILGVSVSTLAGFVFIVIYDKIAMKLPKGKFDEVYSSKNDILKELFGVVSTVALGALITNLTSLIDLTTIIKSLKTATETSAEFFLNYTKNAIPLEDIPNFFFGSFIGLAVTVFNLIPSFTNMFGKGVIPQISEAYALKDELKLKQSVMNVIFTTAFIAVPAGIGISVFSKEILELLFCTRLAEVAVTVSSLKILGIGVVFLSTSSVLFSVLQACGKGENVVKIMLVGVALKFALNIILVRIPEINISGAAFSTTICYFVILIFSTAAIISVTKISLRNVLVLLFKLIFCGIACCLSAYLFETVVFLKLENRFTLIFSVFLGVIIYIILCKILGILTKKTIKLLVY